MSTTMTPPPVPPLPGAATPPPTPPSGPRALSRVIAILAICAGAVILVGAVFAGAFSAVRSAAVRTDTLTASAAGMTELDIDVDAADFRVVYGPGEPTLEVTGSGGASAWRLERDGDTLEVSSHRGWFGGWHWFGGDERAVLTLPERFETTAIDASVDVSGGSAVLSGAYGELEVGLSAGSVEVSGTAQDVDADVSAGQARIDLDDVRSASFELSAGDIEGSLSGRVDDLGIDVSAGRLVLTVPDETYDIVSDVSAGEFRHDLDTSATADRSVTVSVSAGAAILRAAR